MIRAGIIFPLAVAISLCPAIQNARHGLTAGPAPIDLSNVGRQRMSERGYIGDAACYACHKDVAATYQRTSHHLTSQLASKKSILGSFADGSNVLMIANPEISIVTPGLYFKMEARPDGYYEIAVAGLDSHLQSRSERIDVVLGSGVRAQSYLHWNGDQLYEMPVTYWADGRQWINSPGYENGTANFVRPIYPRCLECHATYIQPLSPNPFTNRYSRASLIAGISCETCHGPGAEHRSRQTSGSTAPTGSIPLSILNPSKFSRDRQVDQCALCHNGTQREEIAAAFSYIPGKPLDDYLKKSPMDMAVNLDVHGNQVGLLERSRCYRSSPNMTCSTCHDVHAPERAAAAYSDRCLTCHRVESCGMSKSMGHKIAANCVDCHMPAEPTNVIVSKTADNTVRAIMRNHWIKVYPEIP